MIKGRLFTFGCSLTRYSYPTWADLLGKEWEYFENWGQSGAGNSYIFHSIIECCHRNNLGPNDTVIILWSGLARLDFYQYKKWRSFQNLFPSSTNESIPRYCPDGYEINSFSLMDAIHNLLENKKIKFHSLTWVDINRQTEIAKFFKTTLQQVEYMKFDFNKKIYNNLSSVYIQERFGELWTTLAGKDWPSFEDFINNNYTAVSPEIELELMDFKQKILNDRLLELKYKNEIDAHPLPTQHLASLQRHFPQYKISISTVEWAQQCEYAILHNQPLQFKISVPSNRS
jgi:hypothetical protein